MFEKISFSDYFDSAKANGIEREVMLALEASMNELFNKKPKEYEGTMQQSTNGLMASTLISLLPTLV